MSEALYQKCVNRDTTKDGSMEGMKMDMCVTFDLWFRVPFLGPTDCTGRQYYLCLGNMCEQCALISLRWEAKHPEHVRPLPGETPRCSALSACLTRRAHLQRSAASAPCNQRKFDQTFRYNPQTNEKTYTEEQTDNINSTIIRTRICSYNMINLRAAPQHGENGQV